MDPKRLSMGEWVAGGGALVLLVALFLPWYSAGARDLTGWEALTVADVVLALGATGTLLAVTATARRRRAAVPVAYVTLAAIAGIVAVIVCIVRVADPAPAGDVSRAFGAWLALAGAAGVAGGGWLGMRDEGPARRSDAASREAADAARERAEVVALPPDMGEAT